CRARPGIDRLGLASRRGLPASEVIAVQCVREPLLCANAPLSERFRTIATELENAPGASAMFRAAPREQSSTMVSRNCVRDEKKGAVLRNLGSIPARPIALDPPFAKSPQTASPARHSPPGRVCFGGRAMAECD